MLVKNGVQTSEKFWGYVAGVGEFENGEQKPWGPGKGQKNFENLIFGKSVGNRMCCEMPPYRCKSKSKRRERRSKTMKKWGRNVGKKWRLCSGSRGIRKWWAKALGPRERAQKIENLIFGKGIGKCVCCEVPPNRCKSKSKRWERRSKTMKKWGRNVGKNLRSCSGSSGIRKWWAKAPGAPGKGPKKFEILIFGKRLGKRVYCEVPPYWCKSKSKRRERRSKTMKRE